MQPGEARLDPEQQQRRGEGQHERVQPRRHPQVLRHVQDEEPQEKLVLTARHQNPITFRAQPATIDSRMVVLVISYIGC